MGGTKTEWRRMELSLPIAGNGPILRPSCRAIVLLGNHRQLGELGGGYPNSLETLRHNAVGGRQQADEKIHGRDSRPLVVAGPIESLPEEANHVIGEEFPVQRQNAVGVA